MVDLLVETGLATSKRQAREFLQNGSVSVNGRKVGVEDRVQASHLLHGQIAALRRGKKNWHVTRWV
jgi:tyrosyl-tRNA synthetase